MFKSSLAHAGASWIVLARSQDETPIKVQFGDMRSLAEVARYRNPKASAKNSQPKMLSPEEYRKIVNRALPKCGTVELMAQSGYVAWPEEVGPHDRAGGRFVAVNRVPLSFPLSS